MKFKIISNEKRKIQINWSAIEIYIARWKPFTEFEFEIKRVDKSKKDPIRKYYYGAVLPPFMEELGYDRDETELFHRQLKIVYFKIQPDSHGIYRNVPSVFSNDSELDIEIKSDFIEWVIRKASQSGVYIEPSAGDQE